MKPLKSSEYIKQLDEGESKLIIALNQTGYDLDDLSTLSNINKNRLRKIINGEKPSEREEELLKLIIPQYK